MKRSRLFRGRKLNLKKRLSMFSKKELIAMAVPVAGVPPAIIFMPEALPVLAVAESAISSGLMARSAGRDYSRAVVASKKKKSET